MTCSARTRPGAVAISPVGRANIKSVTAAAFSIALLTGAPLCAAPLCDALTTVLQSSNSSDWPTSVDIGSDTTPCGKSGTYWSCKRNSSLNCEGDAASTGPDMKAEFEILVESVSQCDLPLAKSQDNREFRRWQDKKNISYALARMFLPDDGSEGKPMAAVVARAQSYQEGAKQCAATSLTLEVGAAADFEPFARIR